MDRGDRLTFRWNVVGFRNSNGRLSPRLACDLVIGRASGAAPGRMRPAGHRNDMSARGRGAVFD